ncbi:hypothetical protein GW17_00055186 [Ensete ventricosum]|nr:hypothetical protein GW17_00055186 [Ensete ventricosum]
MRASGIHSQTPWSYELLFCRIRYLCSSSETFAVCDRRTDEDEDEDEDDDICHAINLFELLWDDIDLYCPVRCRADRGWPRERQPKLRGSYSLPAGFLLPSPAINPSPLFPPQPIRFPSASILTSAFLPRKIGRGESMKLSVASFFGSNSKKADKKKSKNRRDSSFGNNASTASSSDESSTSSSLLHASPRSVLPFSVHDLFGVLDRDGDGKIATRELEAVLRRLGPDPLTAEEAASVAAEVGLGGDGCITAEELEALGAKLQLPAAAEAELREAFAVFDADGDGKISAEELLGVFLTLGDDGCTLEDCRCMIQEVDTDGDGFVCFNDFARMMDAQR